MSMCWTPRVRLWHHDPMSHDDTVRRLKARYADSCRYANFGPVLQSLEIHGFRGITDLILMLNSSITALSGLNGTGKSTIAQLAACGYRSRAYGERRRYYVRNFFPLSLADPEPFSPKGRVLYSYCADGSAATQQVTVSRIVHEWSGYKRQPERACYYIGVTQFIPKIERRDFSIYGGHLLELGESRDMPPETAQYISTILALPYEHLGFTEVIHNKRSAELAMATRGGQRYSENNMGFGEGRVVYMVNTMEAAPKQSLFVLEEPETSLHGEAQHRLARYFVDVVGRRGHQIIMTTHSSAILAELGRESVIYLRREPDGSLSATPGLSTYQIDSYLHGDDRSQKGATICVEDSFARYLAIEILRRCDSDLLAGCEVLPVGAGQDIPAAVKLFKRAGLRTVGLCDGDIKPEGVEFMSSLPGSRAPEVEVFTDPAVRAYFAKDPYKISLKEVLVGVADHHDYSSAVAEKLMLETNFVAVEACRAYVNARSPDDFTPIIAFLHKELGDRR